MLKSVKYSFALLLKFLYCNAVPKILIMPSLLPLTIDKLSTLTTDPLLLIKFNSDRLSYFIVLAKI